MEVKPVAVARSNGTNIDFLQKSQGKNAHDFYDSMNLGIFSNGDLAKVQIMTKICDDMAQCYDAVIDEQNEYLLEIDTQLGEIDKLQAELEAEVKERKAERDKIISAAGDEGLSDDDKAEVEKLNSEINGMTSETNSKIGDLNGKVTGASQKAASNADRAETAKDYANTTIEKGEPLANMQDKTKSFWRKLSGSWDKSKERAVGNEAIEAGNNLLTQVQTSSNIEKQVASRRIKKSV